MGCCLIALIGAIWPRVVLVLIYFFKPAIYHRAFETALWPLLGFVFLPTTTLAYELCANYLQGGVHNVVGILVIVLAFLHDMGQFGVLWRRRRGI